MRFDINDIVKVKLNEHGLKILKDRHDELKETFPSIGDYRELKQDGDGFTGFLLWDLMGKFGSHIKLGTNPPFETEIEIPCKSDKNPEGKER